jgi:WD40 repeat protein
MKDPTQVNSRRKHRYKAFISYSHRSDSGFASALQHVIERLAKPWYRRRAMDLFRDETDLAVNPELWPRIVQALDRSEHLLLLGSPSAAQSPWVAKEVEHWKSNYDAANIVVALTDGAIVWDEARCDFDWRETTAIPSILAGAFASEPLWADFRGAKAALKDAAAFRHPAVNLAAGLRGVAPRDLESEDLRQHRRTIRFAVAGLITLLVLTIAAVVATIRALHERDLAMSRELAALSQAALATDPELGVLLALRAEELLPTPQGEQSLRQAVPLSHVKSTFRTDGRYFNALAFSRDGKRIVTSSGWSLLGLHSDFKARVWNAETGQVLAALAGSGPMWTSSFSPDGNLVLTVGSGSGAWLWAADTGNLVADLRGHRASINSASFSPDGKHVVTAGDDGSAFVWNTTPGAAPVELKHPDSVNDASFSPDGLSVVTAIGKWKLLDNIAKGMLSDKQSRFIAQVWDVGAARQRFRLQGFRAPVSIARFSPDGKHIVTVSDDVACLWDARDGRRIAELRGHTAAIGAVAFSSDGRWVATASEDTTARVWDGWTGAQRADLRLHKQPLYSVVISGDGGLLVTAGADPYAVVWDVATGKPLGVLRGHTQAITGLQLNPDEQLVATTSHDGTLRLWRIPPGVIVDPMGPVGLVERMALSTDGERILVENGDRKVSVWARRTGTRLATFGPAQTFSRPAWSADGRRVVVPVESDHAIVYDAGTGAVIKELSEKEANFSIVALSPDGARLAAFEDQRWQHQERTIAIRDVASGKVLARAPMDIALDRGGLQFSPDGTRLIMKQFGIGGNELRDAASGALITKFKGQIIRLSQSSRQILEVDGGNCVSNVYDAHSGKKLSTLTLPGGCFRISDGAISADDHQVVAFDAAGKTVIWDIAEQHIASEFELFLWTLAGLVLSPDGRMMAITGQHKVEIWDLPEKKRVKDVSGSSGDVTAAAFTPDGKALVAAGKDGTVRVYPAEAFLPMEDLISHARSSVSRALSESEVRDLSQD